MPTIQRNPTPTALAAVDAQCFADAWGAEVYADLAANPAVEAWLLTVDDGTAAGLLCFQQVAGEAEVYRIGVVPALRGRGLARRLLEALQARDGAGPGRIHLEVRAGNAPARALYERTGFRQVGTRPGYYQDPPEDAAIYRWEAGAGPDAAETAG